MPRRALRAVPAGVGEVRIDLGVVGLVQPDRRHDLPVDPCSVRGAATSPGESVHGGQRYWRPCEGPDGDLPTVRLTGERLPKRGDLR